MRSQVRVLLSPPKKNHHLSVVIFFGGARTRTHLNAICLWHIAATSSKTGGIYTICPQRDKSAIESCCPPSNPAPPFGGDFLGGARTRTHLNAICRWHIAATSSKTGGNDTICPPKGQIGHRVLLSPPQKSSITFRWCCFFCQHVPKPLLILQSLLIFIQVIWYNLQI